MVNVKIPRRLLCQSNKRFCIIQDRGDEFMSMSISCQKSSTRTNIKHNNRKMSEKEKEQNKHINPTRSHQNKYLLQENLKDLYEKEFGEALQKYNAKQTRQDRKIPDYYKHIQSSKKTSVQQEMIIQVGDKDDFSSNEKRELANDVLEKWFDGFEKRNPNLKIYNAVIHNDEASPHLHINFVPVAGEYKRGMEKQVSFDKAILQQDSTIKKERPFDQWREKEVDLLEKMLKERGIERKLVGKNQYKDVNDYKEKKDLEREIKQLKEIVPNEKTVIPFLKKEIETEVVQKFVGKSEVIERETENYVLSPEQYKELSEQIHAAVVIKKDYEHLKTTDLAKENAQLRIEKEDFRLDFNRVVEKFNTKLDDYKKLEYKYNRLKTHARDLKLELTTTYLSAKKFIKDHTEDSRSFKGAFKKFGDLVKEKTSLVRDKNDLEPKVSEFERTHKKELEKERDNGLSR